VTTFAPTRGVPPAVDLDRPINIPSTDTAADRLFTNLLKACGALVLLLLVAMVVFLVANGWDTLHKEGIHFFTHQVWSYGRSEFGVGSLLLGSIAIAVVGVVLALPVSLATALMINEYAPPRVRPVLTSIVDVLATVPSIIYAFWGVEIVTYIQAPWARWICRYFGFVPIFRSPQPGQDLSAFGKSVFATGLVVSLTLIPIITSVSREVMAQTPRDACEAALGLGGSKWGMVTNVILPFARNGILGAAVLAFGRGIGETMIPTLMLSGGGIITAKIMGPNGLDSVAQQITVNFTEVGRLPESALILAGLMLLVVTLLVGAVARTILTRASAGLR
jgi:phosphate transport system permease protein